MKAIVPAAGIGTRLRPHTHALPKALLHVAGRPIISHILDEVRQLEPSSIVIIVGYKGDLVKAYVEKEYPEINTEFVVQHERNGIGHAVHLTRDVADRGEPLLVILGDTIVRVDLEKFARSKSNALAVKAVADPRRFGVAEVKNGSIVRLVEKPKNPASNLALVGLYYFNDSSMLFEVLEEQIDAGITSHNEYQITDAMQMMIDRGAKFEPYEIDQWFDCGKPEALLETNRQLLEGAPAQDKIAGSIIRDPVSIAPSAKIAGSIIGPHVSIAAGAVVENSIIEDSVVDRGAKVTNCLLKDSIIGAQAVVEGGVQRLNIGDSSEVSVSSNE